MEVRLKAGVTDPEGDNVRKALKLLGFEGVRGVHSAKVFVIDLEARTASAARAQVEEMCGRLLANPVIHDFAIDVEGPAPKVSRARRTSR